MGGRSGGGGGKDGGWGGWLLAERGGFPFQKSAQRQSARQSRRGKQPGKPQHHCRLDGECTAAPPIPHAVAYPQRLQIHVLLCWKPAF